ncbi:Transcription factor MADS-box [Arabidopsis thaliana x Arabidopsis arenosa]|nr:Transcription factor MADS-box [Arabidopsis thaliana x Arabidopsis arenosa]
MGRRKIEIKRIENKSSRQVTFSKRRNGLIDKARQLSILCESSVAVVVVSASGKLYDSSSGDEIEALFKPEKPQCFELDLEEKIQNYLPHKELLETVQRLAVRHIFLPSSSDKKNVFFLLSTCEYSKLEEPNVDNVSVDSLISLEEQLETALSVSRARKAELMMEYIESLKEKEKLLREENQVLASQMGKNTLLATDDERGMFPGSSSGNKIPETLPLLN